MSILEILWMIIKYGFIFSAIFTVLAVLFLLFHPLRLNLKLRSTIKGQRAELWFVYLFRLFKIGIVATPHTQDVVVKIAFWKKRIDRQQREKPEKPHSTPPNDYNSQDTKAFSSADSPLESSPGGDSATGTYQNQTRPSSEGYVPMEDPEAVELPDSQKPSHTEEPEPTSTDTATTSEEPAESQAQHQPEVKQSKDNSSSTMPSSVSSQDEEVVKPVHEEIKPVTDENLHKPEVETPQPAIHAPQSESFRARLRKIKRNMAKKYKQGKYYLRIFMIKWRKLAPIAKKFYNRSKKCFKIDDPNLVIYYALHEPYITGMFQGTLAVMSGTAQRFGFRFVPIPVFGHPMIYARSAATAVIMPWRLVLAIFGLIFEKELWIELWQLAKLLWAKWRNK